MIDVAELDITVLFLFYMCDMYYLFNTIVSYGYIWHSEQVVTLLLCIKTWTKIFKLKFQVNCIAFFPMLPNVLSINLYCLYLFCLFVSFFKDSVNWCLRH